MVIFITLRVQNSVLAFYQNFLNQFVPTFHADFIYLNHGLIATVLKMHSSTVIFAHFGVENRLIESTSSSFAGKIRIKIIGGVLQQDTLVVRV